MAYYIIMIIGIICFLTSVAISTVVTFAYYRFSPKLTKRLRNLALIFMLVGGVLEFISVCIY